MLIGVWFTPFLVRHLGTAGYGLIPLVTMLTSYMSLLTNALNHSVARYLTLALERKNDEEANLIFNSSLFAGVGICGALLLPGLGLIAFADKLIRMPAGYGSQLRALCLFTVMAFLLNTILTPFGAATFARNRFDLRNLVDMSQNVTRVGLTVLLFHIAAPQLWHVGLGVLAGGIVSGIGLVYFWRLLTPVLRISWKAVEWQTLRMLSQTGIWVVVYQFGTILFLGIDLVVINRLLGAEAGGRYAVVLQWSALLRSVGITIGAVFAPTIMALYAGGDIDSLYHYAGRAAKVLGLALALPIGILYGLSDKVLLLWLGPRFVDLAGLMRLLLAPLCVNLAVLPLFSIDLAVNKVRIPAMVTLALGAVNLGLALVLAGPAGLGMYGVALAGGIVLTGKNLIFTSFYTAHNIRRSALGFLQKIAVSAVATFGVAVWAHYAGRAVGITSWARLVGFAALTGCLFAATAYSLLLNSSERRLLTEMVQRATKRKSWQALPQ
jgi:membrane protein EpsK